MSSRFALAALSLVATGCLDTTQLTFDITTDVPCSEMSGLSITVGVKGKTENAAPTKVVKTCDANGKVNIIGTYAITPKEGKEVLASVRLALAVGDGLNVANDCTAAKEYKGCIVARRTMSFVAHRSLTVPIEMLLICKDVRCDEDTTCSSIGRCESSLIDFSRCDDLGNCSPGPTAGGGVPCFNTGAANPLFCAGESGWCTRNAGGQRACSRAPVQGGVSYQCRNSGDCGPNLQCVAGSDGVLGHCVSAPSVTDVVLCTFGEPHSPCPTGPFGCALDAGGDLLRCLPLDAGPRVRDPDAGLPCPRTGDLNCGGTTPFCQTITGTPTCVADGGAQCWYPSDCPAGNSCYAGVQGRFFNACQAGPTASNPVALCNEALDGGDCPAGYACDGQFYGFRSCRNLHPAVTPCPPIAGADAGLFCGESAPVCAQQADGGYGCGNTPSGSLPAWACADQTVCAPGQRCVYRRDTQRSDGLTSVCALADTNASQAVVCRDSNDCDPGRTCSPAVGDGQLRLCTNAQVGCDRYFFTSNMCGTGLCCSAPSLGRACTDLITCVSTTSGTPWTCNSAVQCGAHQFCSFTLTSSMLPNGGIVCVDLPSDGGTVFSRDIQCQPETASIDCPPELPGCYFLANTGSYVCRQATDAGFFGPGANVTVSEGDAGATVLQVRPWR